MGWTARQIQIAHIVKGKVGWERPQYELVLKNIAGIKPWPSRTGKISSKNPTADNHGFERFMAFAEQEGYVDPENGQGYWSQQAMKQRSRMQYKIVELVARADAAKIFRKDGLPGFVERQTAKRPGGPTRNLEECDWKYTYDVLEGLKGLVNREARKRGIVLTK